MAAPGKSPLSVRERRAWARKFMEAQEAVEAAEAARNRVFAQGLRAGASYASIEMATGLGPVTVRKSIDDAGRVGEDQ